MTTTTNVYKKNFSNVMNIQVAEQLYYNLYEKETDNLITYGIELISKRADGDEIAFLGQISESRTYVLDIIKFLYENSIKPNTALEIVSDILNSIFCGNSCSLEENLA